MGSAKDSLSDSPIHFFDFKTVDFLRDVPVQNSLALSVLLTKFICD